MRRAGARRPVKLSPDLAHARSRTGVNPNLPDRCRALCDRGCVTWDVDAVDQPVELLRPEREAARRLRRGRCGQEALTRRADYSDRSGDSGSSDEVFALVLASY